MWPSASVRAIPSWRRSAASNATSHVRCSCSSSSARRRSTGRESLLDKQKGVRGSQYCSIDYQAKLEKHGILFSMSPKGNCCDNAMVETFFKTLKSERVWRTVFDTRQDADQAIGRCIDGFYNPLRRHSALDFISPAQFEKHAAK